MKAQDELALLLRPQPSLISIGVFDGVHQGHQYLLQRLHQEARRRGYRSTAVTFRNNPRMALRPHDPQVPYIASLEQRLDLLEEQVDLVAPLTFDLELSSLRAKEFFAMLQEALDLRGLVVGPDFAFGHGREVQTLTALRQMGEEMGFTAEVVEPMELAGDIVSSTAIRRALGQGDVERAARLLGRPFLLMGHVAPGQGRGRLLGFPTANLAVDPSLVVPGDGIYATWAHVDGARHLSATSIGVRPTFGGGQRTVETYVMDFSAELYGKELRLEFVLRLRDEQRFESEEGLMAQMQRDVAQARVALGAVVPEQAGGLQPQSLQR